MTTFLHILADLYAAAILVVVLALVAAALLDKWTRRSVERHVGRALSRPVDRQWTRTDDQAAVARAWEQWGQR